MNTEEQIRLGISCIPLAIFVVPILCVLIPQAIKNKKQNKEAEGFPEWKSSSRCPRCDFPIGPPLRYVTYFPNPICPTKWRKETKSCSKCDYQKIVKVKVD